MTTTASTLESRTFLDLVARVKIAVTLESGVLDLKCPCGTAILPPTPVIPKLKDSQPGLMKSRIQRYLQERHGLSEKTVRVIIKEALA
jgi:hypothetical protein